MRVRGKTQVQGQKVFALLFLVEKPCVGEDFVAKIDSRC